MKETFLLISARNLTPPLWTEMCEWLAGFDLKPETDEEEFLRHVWQEVGNDLRGAMRGCPIERAQADTDRSLPVSAA